VGRWLMCSDILFPMFSLCVACLALGFAVGGGR
jgi:hypothetical protein